MDDELFMGTADPLENGEATTQSNGFADLALK